MCKNIIVHTYLYTRNYAAIYLYYITYSLTLQFDELNVDITIRG